MGETLKSESHSSRKRRRDRSRSRSRSRSSRPSSRREDRKKSRRKRSRSCSRSPSKSGGSDHDDQRKKKETKKERRDRDRSRSRSRPRGGGGSRREKDSSKRRSRKDRSRSHSPSHSKSNMNTISITDNNTNKIVKEVETTSSQQETVVEFKKEVTKSTSSSKKKDRSRSRSHTRKRSHSRSRSRSRSRGRETKKAQEKSSTEKKQIKSNFKFGGMSLKSIHGKNQKNPKAFDTLKTKTTNSKGDSTVTSEEEKQRRREKLKIWREKQKEKQKQEQLMSQFLAEDDVIPKPLQINGLWSVEAEETEEEVKKKEKNKEIQRQRVQQIIDEVDPLDAYMAGLVDEAAIQKSLANPSSNVISLDEIEKQQNNNQKIDIYGTFLPPQKEEEEEKEKEKKMIHSDTTTSFSSIIVGDNTLIEKKETEEEKEAREEKELKEFMKAFRKHEACTIIKETEKDAKASTTTTTTTTTKTMKLTATTSGSSFFNNTNTNTNINTSTTGRIYQGFDEDLIGEEADKEAEKTSLEILQEAAAQKKKEIKPVDHTKIKYLNFLKKFFVCPKEIKELTEEKIQEIRQQLEIKIRGKNCPRPIEKWSQCGFSLRMLQLIQKNGYLEPFAIQRQALPAIMSGRDVIGIAKTGSGKTLAFLLPMFRHILHQPPLKENEGPIGLIMAPARELVQQIFVEAKKFAKDLGLRATAVYGGSSVSEQIANLKRGSDIVICTPGRMIDILCMSAGKMVSLQRVTYVVLDEADRMFDMGFEPQITKILLNIRPDRQTLLFSATFPRAVENLARKILIKPIELTIGTRSTASGDITQYVEVREEKDKFMRLLQLLGLWYEKGNILVFVNTQPACDQLFQDLLRAGYPALSLHGGKDQIDRDFTIDDFKRKVRTLMVATSVAGRGLDVKDLVLVINYHCPNHLEDYVHRVGRTGRAGKKGTAYTFISPDEEEYAVDLVGALENGKQKIPPELIALAERFKEKVKRGEARFHGSGFKGKGFTFDENEKNEAQRTADLQKRQYEISEGIVVEDAAAEEEEEEDYEEEHYEEENEKEEIQTIHTNNKMEKPMEITLSSFASRSNADALSAVKKAQQIAQILDMQYKQNQANAGATEGHFIEELEINDYPQQARWRVTQKEASESVAELTGAAIIARGSYIPAGRKPNIGERKLYLAIEGPTRASVIDAKRELQRILDETTLQVGLGGDKYGKYNL